MPCTLDRQLLVSETVAVVFFDIANVELENISFLSDICTKALNMYNSDIVTGPHFFPLTMTGTLEVLAEFLVDVIKEKPPNILLLAS